MSFDLSVFANKNIILAVTGGIAAYKSAILVRRLKDYGFNVRVVMTQGAQAFITPLTFQALSGNPVHTTLLDPEAEAGMGHIELARWADLVLVAPASCDTIAKFAAGLADDLLSTLYLATKAPVWVAPAMNQQMWAAKPTQRNLNTLIEDGVHVIMPEAGSQACGDVGLGRMPEPEQLADQVKDYFHQAQRAIAEKFVARKRSEKLAVTSLDVDTVIHEMGSPVEFSEDEHNGESEQLEPVQKEAGTEPKKRLYRDLDDAVIAGVASGLARYFDIDPVIVRLIFVVAALFNGLGILVYIVLWLVVPIAETTADKYAMRGERVTLRDISERVKKI